ncbi:uncharacterized protein LOC143285172 [Babylonia areolata]|uniref:uncharacterized protein LOC143285172 n=1 Tax=Babylonia areolata TaxID=304850 RepID=UPI003FD14A99
MHTLNLVWTSSYNCFNFCHTFCYTFHTLCCGFCAALHAGAQIATAFFCHVWCGTPCTKAVHFVLMLPRRLVVECVDCMVRPCCEDMGTHLHTFLDT